MTQKKVSALAQAECDALDTLYDATIRASQAFAAVQAKLDAGGSIQRLGPGIWIVSHDIPDASTESP